MAQNIHTEIRKARKPRRDDSADFILEALDYIRSCGRLTFREMRAVARLKNANWQIQKGQLYERQYNVSDGRTYNFCTLPEIAKICNKLGLYDE